MEVLVALAVLGLMVAVVPMAYGKLQETLRYQDAVRQVTTEIRLARNLAMQTGQPRVLVIDLARGQVHVEGRDPVQLPQRVGMEAEFARMEQIDDRVGAIRFYPDGSATGGRITLVRPGGGGVHLQVNWLLGRVTQEPLA